MIVVIDPGVAIKWFVEEPLRPQARSLLVHGHEVVAPDILIAGVALVPRRTLQLNHVRNGRHVLPTASFI